jgi:carbamoyltransferase
MDHAYWGPSFEPDAIAAVLTENRAAIAEKKCAVEEIADEADLCRWAAEAIADGKVVGWFQGRMEWGPRALGNRSIVCDPRRANGANRFGRLRRQYSKKWCGSGSRKMMRSRS